MFVPVTSPHGSGEYSRALAIANALAGRWPDADIHFLLSRHAAYAADLPFPATHLPASPTLHTPEVNAAIRSFRPTLAVFDNAGRTSQLRAAREAGARVVFVSSRPRQRNRAFRMRWMRLLDEHWIAYPQVLAGPLTLLERCKHRVLNAPTVRFMDTIAPPPDPVLAGDLLAHHGLHDGEYVLVVPGGGTGHRRMPQGPRVMAEAARRVAARGHATLLVGAQTAQDDDPAVLRRLPRLDMPRLLALVRHAKVVICNGGDTLLQVLACGRPCVAAPMVPDQRRRLRRLRSAGIPVGTSLNAALLATEAVALVEHDERRAALAECIARQRIEDGTPTALAAIAALHGVAARCSLPGAA